MGVIIVDVKQAVEILRDTESYSASNEDFKKGIWTHIDIEMVNASEIANFIEQQEKYAELGRLMVRHNMCDKPTGFNKESFCKFCDGFELCLKRVELLTEVQK